MDFFSKCYESPEPGSADTARAAADALIAAFDQTPLKAVVVYASVNHDQAVLLGTLRERLGSDVIILGCSSQGVVFQEGLHEGGYFLGVMGLGGDELRVAQASQVELAEDTRAKGRALAKDVRSQLPDVPKVLIVLYDPLCGADVEEMLAGVREIVDCPLVGAGAGQPWGPIVETFQYWGDQVHGHSVTALGLSGPFEADLGVSHGTAPTGVVMTLTRAEGNKLLELDGRPAIEVWREVTGCSDEQIYDQEYVSSWAVGVEREFDVDGKKQQAFVIRAAFGFDLDRNAVVVQAAIPEGTRIMFHHRSVPAVKDGALAMAKDLKQRLNGKEPWSVLGFECGARTSPFLGEGETLSENIEIQRVIGPQTPWLGMMAWGEIAPLGNLPAFHNYTYPLLVLSTPSAD